MGVRGSCRRWPQHRLAVEDRGHRRGSRVTETFDAPVLDAEFFQKIGRCELLVDNIARSLENLKAVAEAG